MCVYMTDCAREHALVASVCVRVCESMDFGPSAADVCARLPRCVMCT